MMADGHSGDTTQGAREANIHDGINYHCFLVCSELQHWWFSWPSPSQHPGERFAHVLCQEQWTYGAPAAHRGPLPRFETVRTTSLLLSQRKQNGVRHQVTQKPHFTRQYSADEIKQVKHHCQVHHSNEARRQGYCWCYTGTMSTTATACSFQCCLPLGPLAEQHPGTIAREFSTPLWIILFNRIFCVYRAVTLTTSLHCKN